MCNLEEFDNAKTKVLKYVLYKKRSEHEIRTKFALTIEENLLDDVIEYLKEAKYIDDTVYIERTINEIMALRNLSLKEIKYKLFAKGLDKSLIEDYLYAHKEELEEYEKKSAENIIYKKSSSMDKEEIKNYLLKKGYKSDIISKVL